MGTDGACKLKRLPLTGHETKVRRGDFLYASHETFNLGRYDLKGTLVQKEKVGIDSFHLFLDGDVLLAHTGDGGTFYQLAPDGTFSLSCKKKGIRARPGRLAFQDGLLLVPTPSDAKAKELKKAFAFEIWATR